MKSKVRTIIATLVVLSMVLFSGAMNSRVKIDYGNSALYSKNEMKEAIELIVSEVSEWDGCELCQVSYAGDQVSMEALEYCNRLTMNQLNDECIVLKSSFSTSKNSKLAGPFEPNSLYTVWMWYLARDNGRSWKIITYGY